MYAMQKENVHGRARIYAFCVRINSEENPIMPIFLRTSEICKQPKKRQSAITIRMPTAGIRNARIYERRRFLLSAAAVTRLLTRTKLHTTTHGRSDGDDGGDGCGRHSRIRAASTHRFTK